MCSRNSGVPTTSLVPPRAGAGNRHAARLKFVLRPQIEGAPIWLMAHGSPGQAARSVPAERPVRVRCRHASTF